jgi:hypothetical protein
LNRTAAIRSARTAKLVGRAFPKASSGDTWRSVAAPPRSSVN